MGKAKITGNLTEGRYRVQRTYNDEGAIAQRNALQDRAAELSARIPQLDSAVFSAVLDFQAAEQAAAVAQADYAAAVRGAEGAPSLADALAAVQAAQERIIRAAAERDRLRAERASVVASYEAARRRLLQIQSALAAPEQEVWCADYTEDAEGEVASIEVPGEPQKLLLRPQFEGRGAHEGERDGMLQPRGILTPEQSYFNVAVLPGWQKWKPTYRIGTITEVEGDICNVDLDPAESSEVGTGNRLGINRFDRLEGVPIEYMDCNGSVFEPEDRVVVEFEGQEWTAPKVIGFESNPKRCEVPVYLFTHGGVAPPPSDQERNWNQQIIELNGGYDGPRRIAYSYNASQVLDSVDSETGHETWAYRFIGAAAAVNGKVAVTIREGVREEKTDENTASTFQVFRWTDTMIFPSGAQTQVNYDQEGARTSIYALFSYGRTFCACVNDEGTQGEAGSGGVQIWEYDEEGAFIRAVPLQDGIANYGTPAANSSIYLIHSDRGTTLEGPFAFNHSGGLVWSQPAINFGAASFGVNDNGLAVERGFNDGGTVISIRLLDSTNGATLVPSIMATANGIILHDCMIGLRSVFITFLDGGISFLRVYRIIEPEEEGAGWAVEQIGSDVRISDIGPTGSGFGTSVANGGRVLFADTARLHG